MCTKLLVSFWGVDSASGARLSPECATTVAAHDVATMKEKKVRKTT